MSTAIKERKPAPKIGKDARYYEDLNPGDSWVSPRRTITEADIVMFAAMTRSQSDPHR